MNIVSELVAYDLVLGTLAKEAIKCSEEHKNMAALACLFILVEYAVKLALNRTGGIFYQLLKTAKRLLPDSFLAVQKMPNSGEKIFW